VSGASGGALAFVRKGQCRRAELVRATLSRGLVACGDEYVARSLGDVGWSSGYGRPAEVQAGAVPGERRAGLVGGGVHSRPEVGRRRPGIVDIVAGRDPQILVTCEAVGGEDDLAAVPADVGLNVGCRAVQLLDRLGGAEVVRAQPLANVDVGAAREVERRLTGVDVGGAHLVEGAVGASVGRAGEVQRVAPAVVRVVAGEIDVRSSAGPLDGPVADEEEAAAADRRGAEVVGRRVDRRAEVLGRPPGRVPARAVRDPDVEVRPGVACEARPVGGHVEAQPVR
jgi:hypothetical protein